MSNNYTPSVCHKGFLLVLVILLSVGIAYPTSAETISPQTSLSESNNILQGNSLTTGIDRYHSDFEIASMPRGMFLGNYVYEMLYFINALEREHRVIKKSMARYARDDDLVEKKNNQYVGVPVSTGANNRSVAIEREISEKQIADFANSVRKAKKSALDKPPVIIERGDGVRIQAQLQEVPWLKKTAKALYREIVAACKARRLVYAQEKIIEMEEIVHSANFPENTRTYYNRKLAKVKKRWLSDYYSPEEIQAAQKKDKSTPAPVARRPTKLHTDDGVVETRKDLPTAREKQVAIPQKQERSGDAVAAKTESKHNLSILPFVHYKRSRPLSPRSITSALYKEAKVFFANGKYSLTQKKLRELEEFILTHDVSYRYRMIIFRKIANIERDILLRQKHFLTDIGKKQQKDIDTTISEKRNELTFDSSKIDLQTVKPIDDDTFHTEVPDERPPKPKGFHFTEEIIANKKEEARQMQQKVKTTTQVALAQVYEKAKKLYEEKKFKRAKGLFLVLKEQFGDYEDIDEYLEKIDVDIDNRAFEIIAEKRAELPRIREQRRLVREKEWDKLFVAVEKMYQQALEYYDQGYFRSAKRRFLDISEIMGDYKKTQEFLSHIDHDICEADNNRMTQELKDSQRMKADELAYERRVARIESATARKQMKSRARALYKDAIHLYEEQQYHRAYVKFQDVSAILPHYKDTQKYIKKIDRIVLQGRS